MEKDVEAYVRREVKKMGGKLLKWVCPGNDGVPDRILMLPGGRIWFIEFKDGGGKVSPLQTYWMDELYNLGFSSFVVRGMPQAQTLIGLLQDRWSEEAGDEV
jgi:hypothetical protein